MLSLRSIVLMMMVPLALAGCVTTAVVGGTTVASSVNDERSLGNQVDDTKAAAKIDALLIAEKDMPSRWVSVQVIEGVATLTGYLPSQSHIDRAIYIAGNVEGVKSVHSELKIGEPKIGNLFTDTWITTQVKTKYLNDKVVSGFSIHVETVDGKVYLQGIVNNFIQRQRAKDIALKVEGVTAVVDLMKVNKM